LFDRFEGGQRALLVSLQFPQTTRDPTEAIAELRELTESAGAEVLDTVVGRRDKPDPKLFVGSGKCDEIAERVKMLDVDLVVFNHALAPSQERNLERVLQCRVLDRTGLILDIFSQRARSFEGKLQVELAQLRHLSTRLIRGWTHLERQKGGIGLRGPGETQLETDRRLIGHRIKRLSQTLERVRARRERGRASRRKADVATVSLVGYTNAGKSTLFNALTDASVYAADRLFATLDPTLRRLALPGGREAVLADTVGFVSDLPHELVEAFHATLQESAEATLLLHVIDCADPVRHELVAAVEEVLQSVGAEHVPTIEVYTKSDLLDEPARIERDQDGVPTRVWVSALSGDGLGLLREAIAACVGGSRVRGALTIAPSDGRLRAALYHLGAVKHERSLENGALELDVDMDSVDWARLVKREGLSESSLRA